MRNPIDVLNSLSEKSKNPSYRFQRLYRNLYNPEFYMLAYKNIYANDGSMTPGMDGTTLDGMSSRRIDGIITSLRDHSYQPKPARREYIPKKSDPNKKRPLGIPSANDKLVQEVVRLILESIYEPNFSENSHGFRPRKSCHTALFHLQRTFTGAKWFVEGDIKACFDGFDHHVLIDILRRRIDDEAFIALMWKFLKAGYMEQWEYHKTYSGTPQGSGISPILANIYLNELDRHITEYKATFDCGSSTKRKVNPEYERMRGTIKRAKRRNAKMWDELDEAERKQKAAEVRYMKAEHRKLSRSDPFDANYKSLQYIRYADDFIIGVIGSKVDCEKIKADITKYMSDVLNLELSAEKTLITHAQDTAKFLGYELSVRKSYAMKRNRKGVLQRDFNGRVVLTLPIETVKKKLKEYDAISFEQANGKEIWKPKSRSHLTAMQPHDILAQFNWEIRGFYNYYSIANNVSATCSKFGYIMEYSMYLTLAQKLRSTISKLKKKYETNKQFIIPYKDDKGRQQYRILYDDGFKRQTTNANTNCDTQPFTVIVPPPTLVERLKTNRCELCGVESPTVMHHVRTLKTLSKEYEWNRIMLNRNRKTLAVCPSCNAKIQEHEK